MYLKDLILKLTILLASTAAGRASEICFLDAKYLVKHLSITRKSIKFNSFRENKAFFACGHIDFCIEKTKVLRKDESQLLLSFILPHGIISTQTISHLILQLLSLAAINTRTFSAKSTSPKWCSHKRNFKNGFYCKDILEGRIRSGDDFMR